MKIATRKTRPGRMKAWKVPALVRFLINTCVLHIVQVIALPENEYKAMT